MIDYSVQTKLASLTEEDVYALFEKQAAYEGFSPDDLAYVDDAALGGAFDHFVENVLPDMAANDWSPMDYTGVEKTAEATAKLAEADLLGRHMAFAFNDELEKMAGAGATAKRVMGRAGELLGGSRFKALNSLERARFADPGVMEGAAGAAADKAGLIRSAFRRHPKDAINLKTREARKVLATRTALGLGAAGAGLGALGAAGAAGAGVGAAGTAGLGAAGYGAKRLYDRRKGAGADLDAYIEDRALEILAANGY